MFHYGSIQEKEPKSQESWKARHVCGSAAHQEKARWARKHRTPGIKKSWERQNQGRRPWRCKKKEQKKVSNVGQCPWNGSKMSKPKERSPLSQSCVKKRLRESQGGIYPIRPFLQSCYQRPTSFPFLQYRKTLKIFKFSSRISSNAKMRPFKVLSTKDTIKSKLLFHLQPSFLSCRVNNWE